MITTTSRERSVTGRVGPGSPGRWDIIARVLLTLAAVVTLGAPAFGITGNMPVIVAAIPVALILAGRRYGWKMLALYLAVTITVSTVFENLSITTGFPFGHYHYPGNSPRLWNFPIFVAVAYSALGLICWLVTSALLDGADRRLHDRTDPTRRINLVAQPALAAALMTMYDLGSDSTASTVSHIWVWENGGGVFGVPLTNYLGWWLVTYIFFQIFALALAIRHPGDVRDGLHRREPLAHAVALYFMFAMASLPAFLNAGNGTITDQTGAVWSARDLAETMVTINLFGVVVIAALAAAKLARNDLAVRDHVRFCEGPG